MALLHILWMILRFLLILLGIILGLILLVILLVLFCPIRYRASVAKETESIKEITASASVSWLFRGIRLIVDYREGSIQPDLRLFGISLMKVKTFLEERKKKKEQAALDKKRQAESEPDRQPDKEKGSEKTVEKISEKGSEKAVEKIPGKDPEKAVEKRTDKTAEENSRKERQVKYSDIQAAHQRTKSPPEYGGSFAEEKEKAVRRQANSQKAGADTEMPDEEAVDVREPLLFRLIEALFKKIEGFFQKISSLSERIRTGIQSLLKKKESLEKKAESWKEFLSHPSIKSAVSLIWRKVKLLLKHIFPTKMAGDVAFGLEDPSTTGQILAIVGMTIPLHRNAIKIHPDFEGENHFEGNVWLKGRIYGIVFAVTALRILLDKNIRYIYRRVKNKEE